MHNRFIKGATAGLAGVLLVGGAAHAERLNYAFGFSITSAVGTAAEDYAAAVAEHSGGTVTIRNFPMSLLSLLETGPGLRDGLADVGYVLAPYYAAEYPHYSLIHELSLSVNLRELTGKESLAYAGAITQYTFESCPECHADFAAQNQVYLSGATSSMYANLCTTPVREASDMRGLRIRAGSPSFARFSENFGAIGIQMAANEVFEALSQGVLDCAMLSAPELSNLSLNEVVTDITIGVPGGLYAGAAVGNANLQRWQGLDDQQREAMLWGAHLLSADISWNYYALDAENIDDARERGINVHHASEAFSEEIRDYVRSDLESVAQTFTETYGVTRAEEIVAEFLPLLEHWYTLVEDVESREDLRTLFWNEIYANVDPSTHGL